MMSNFSMKNSYLINFGRWLLVAGAFLVGGCVAGERTVPPSPPALAVGNEVVVAQAPPMPVVETMTIAPGPGFVWIPGVWAWRGQWVWDRGHWAHPPEAGAIWVAPRYEDRNGTRVFIQGGWKY
jgi:hypothetical protein